MDYYNQNNRQPQYETNDEYDMNSEFEMENMYSNTEFNYEAGQDYELLPELELADELEFDNEFEYDNGSNEFEYNGNNEVNNEFEGGAGTGDYGELENSYEGYKDEMEAELEYVTNEEEFSNWVNEVVVRDHRNRALRPALSRPIVQKAVRQLSRIASRTLPYLGKRVGGWRGAWRRPVYPTHRKPYPTPWPRPPYGRRYGYPRPYPYGGSILSTQQTYNPTDTSQSQPGFSGADSTAVPQQTDQDGSFKNFVIETIKNLTQQIAAGNESLAALKSSMVNSAVNNFPVAVQPKTDAPDTAPPPAGTPPQSEFEFEDYEYDTETDNEFEMGIDGEVSDSEGSFSEETEMELASNLLSVRNDGELDHFIGGLLKKAIGAVSGLLTSDQGKMLKGIFKSVAKKALPIAGAAAGTFFGGPAGAAIGEKLGTTASGLFELELEGMSNEDREFETARAMVRFAGNAARQVADQMSDNPLQDVRNGVTKAAMRYAPGLLMRRGRGSRRYAGGYHGGYSDYGADNIHGTNSGANGTWYRRGNKIIIENI